MKQIVKVVSLAILLSSSTLLAEPSHKHHANKAVSEQIVVSKGEIVSFDLKNKKVVIEHEAIEALSWPSMVMRFSFENSDMIKDLKEGDEVEFSFIQQGRISLLQSIKSIK